MDYTVIGDSVNIAARLCSSAKAGQILISETTYAEVKKLVKVEELEPITVKGKSKPLHIYNVVGLNK
jgi:adenylate cyclase